MKFFSHVIVALTCLRYLNTVRANVPVFEVLGAFDFNPTRKNSHLFILGTEQGAKQRDNYFKEEITAGKIHSLAWISFPGLMEFWSNDNETLSPYHKLFGDKHGTSLVVHPETQEDLFTFVSLDDVNLDMEARFRRESGQTINEFIDGSAVSLYRDLRDMLNFTEKAFAGDSLGWNSNNEVSGKSFELIQSDQALISISQVTILYDRAKFLHYLQPTSYGNGVVVFFIQPPLNSVRNVFFSPFTSDVWITIGLTWLAIIVLMMISSGVKYRAAGISGHIEDITDATFLNDAVIWAIGSMCQKGWPRQPHSPSLRILFICGGVMALLLYIAYSASIVSVLSVKSVPVKEFADLISYHFLYYVHEKSFTLQTFLKDKIIDAYNLSQDVLKVPTEREVSILLTDSNALVTYADVFYSATRTLNYTERFVCESLSQVPCSSYTGTSAMFVKKGSPFRETFDYKFMMLKERGFISRYNNIYISNTRISCQSNENAKRIKLNYSDLYTAFMIIIAGFSASLVIMMIEKLVGTASSIVTQSLVGYIYYRIKEISKC
ncbi:unnamed protein product [Allacma fusca]|uniref:Ionotropic glutamate receptor C-terminal domain-containing protein n=1 Tax=Allacma fusca TaxID=39272 RepID=A0A8J2KZB9_9HEXA|nr:unnamed protein product [Allacma fusca]